MTLREDLVATRALIDTPEKWGHGKGFSYRGGVSSICVWIAIHRAIGTTGERLMGAYDALLAALPWWWRVRARMSNDVRDAWIIRFNDHPNTRHTDVMSLLDRAIEAAP